ncbi:MAG TPA: membrane dipeptidase, partial [Gemmatimonadaceae bacterium]|nr:membrane dipeptidase [Gemmatimonadaceae bacterium]
MRKLPVVLALLVAVGLVVFFTRGADMADRSMNTLLAPGPYTGPASVDTLLGSLDVVDLHADALLWPRDLLERHDHGHVDVPRLQEGHVALQVFSVVSKTPRGINYDRNTAETDNITILAIAERYPFRAWFSVFERARWQGARLRDAIARSDARGDSALRLIRTRGDLASLLAARRRGRPVIGALLATEGLHPLEGRLEHLDSLAADGFRMLGFTHFFDNEVGGSAHGVSKGGLTPFGRAAVARMDSLGLVIDVAHASPRLVDDILATTRRPVVVSHGGVQATCPGPRNLSDDQLRRIAAGGGVVGIGYWDGAICEPTAAAFARAVAHAMRVAGEDHVALGSDFDGSTAVPFDASGMGLV